MGACSVIGLTILGYSSYLTRRARGENAGPLQLRLGPRGYAQRFGPGQVELTPWNRIKTVEARSLNGKSWAFRVVRRSRALNWRFKRCDVDVESPTIIVMRASKDEIREVMRRVGEWIGKDAVWRDSPNGEQFVGVASK